MLEQTHQFKAIETIYKHVITCSSAKHTLWIHVANRSNIKSISTRSTDVLLFASDRFQSLWFDLIDKQNFMCELCAFVACQWLITICFGKIDPRAHYNSYSFWQPIFTQSQLLNQFDSNKS